MHVSFDKRLSKISNFQMFSDLPEILFCVRLVMVLNILGWLKFLTCVTNCRQLELKLSQIAFYQFIDPHDEV